MSQTLLITMGEVDLKLLVKECIREELDRAIIRPDPTKELHGYLSIKDITQIFKISKVTVNTWQKKGILQGCTIGRRVYFKKDELEQQLSSYKGNWRQEKHLMSALHMNSQLED